MDITLRKARVSDAAALLPLVCKDLGYASCTPAMLEKSLADVLPDEAQRVLVAEVGGAVAGYIQLQLYQPVYTPLFVNVVGIAVSGAHRRLGIGRMLLQAAEEWAAQTGAAGVRLVSSEHRTGAHEFYRRCGFTLRKKQLSFIKWL